MNFTPFLFPFKALYLYIYLYSIKDQLKTVYYYVKLLNLGLKGFGSAGPKTLVLNISRVSCDVFESQEN